MTTINTIHQLADNINFNPIEGVGEYQKPSKWIIPGVAAGTLETIISNVVGFLTIVAGLAFVIYFIIGALTWITARDEAERMSKSKQMLTNSLLGLAIVVVSWALAGVLGIIFGFEILKPAALIQNIMPK